MGQVSASCTVLFMTSSLMALRHTNFFLNLFIYLGPPPLSCPLMSALPKMVIMTAVFKFSHSGTPFHIFSPSLALSQLLINCLQPPLPYVHPDSALCYLQIASEYSTVLTQPHSTSFLLLLKPNQNSCLCSLLSLPSSAIHHNIPFS